MAIRVNLDVMLAKRKMSVGELAERVGITPANVSVLKNGPNQVPVPDSIQQTVVCHHDLQFFIPPAILRQRNGHRQPVVLHPCPGLSISRHPSFEHRLPVTVTDRKSVV